MLGAEGQVGCCGVTSMGCAGPYTPPLSSTLFPHPGWTQTGGDRPPEPGEESERWKGFRQGQCALGWHRVCAHERGLISPHKAPQHPLTPWSRAVIPHPPSLSPIPTAAATSGQALSKPGLCPRLCSHPTSPQKSLLAFRVLQ